MNKFDQLYNLILEQKLSNTDETAIFKLLNKEIGSYLNRIKYQYGQALLPDRTRSPRRQDHSNGRPDRSHRR